MIEPPLPEWKRFCLVNSPQFFKGFLLIRFTPLQKVFYEFRHLDSPSHSQSSLPGQVVSYQVTKIPTSKLRDAEKTVAPSPWHWSWVLLLGVPEIPKTSVFTLFSECYSSLGWFQKRSRKWVRALHLFCWRSIAIAMRSKQTQSLKQILSAQWMHRNLKKRRLSQSSIPASESVKTCMMHKSTTQLTSLSNMFSLHRTTHILYSQWCDLREYFWAN